MKKVIALLFGTLFLSQIFAQISIQGQFQSFEKQMSEIQLYHIVTKKIVKNTPINDDGSFLLEADIQKEDFYYLQNNKNKQKILLLLKPDEKINIVLNPNQFNSIAKFSGSEGTSVILEGTTKSNQYEKELQKYKGDFVRLQRDGGNEEALAQAKKLYEDKSKEYTNFLKDFIHKNNQSLAVITIIDKLPIESFIDTYKDYVATAGKKYPKNPFINQLASRVKVEQATGIGNEAPEIALPNPEGEIVKLSSLRGKVVLIDFWASWCRPCRRENPNVVRLYNKYKDKGFEVFSVSLDSRKDSWIKAIQDDKLTWTHVSDLKKWRNAAAQDYGVSSIPATVLIDKEGKIIASKLRGPSLEKKLEEIFGF